MPQAPPAYQHAPRTTLLPPPTWAETAAAHEAATMWVAPHSAPQQHPAARPGPSGPPGSRLPSAGRAAPGPHPPPQQPAPRRSTWSAGTPPDSPPQRADMTPNSRPASRSSDRVTGYHGTVNMQPRSDGPATSGPSGTVCWNHDASVVSNVFL